MHRIYASVSFLFARRVAAGTRVAPLSLLLAAMLTVVSCTRDNRSPMAPSPSSSSSASFSAATGAVGEGVAAALSRRLSFGPRLGAYRLAVAFPPRDESFRFGDDLNTHYGSVLGRGAVETFVDLEGWIVWIQEFLRYRVNGCSPDEAAFAVGVQIGGGPVLPVCGDPPSGVVNFPPRDETFAFGLALDEVYDEVLEREPVTANVDLEGWGVWIQEYLRYRVNNCGHDEASGKVFTQIGGGGVQPVC